MESCRTGEGSHGRHMKLFSLGGSMKKLILKIGRKIGRSLGMVGIGRYLAGITLAAAMVCSVASAQVGAAALSGGVQDQTGAVIPSASVTLQNAASGQQRMVKTNGSGSFNFAAVPSG